MINNLSLVNFKFNKFNTLIFVILRTRKLGLSLEVIDLTEEEILLFQTFM